MATKPTRIPVTKIEVDSLQKNQTAAFVVSAQDTVNSHWDTKELFELTKIT